MSQVTINGVDFYYDLLGQGKVPIVFVSGYRCDHSLWTDVAAAFTSTHKILIFDNQGSGETKDQGMPLTAWSMAENLYALIERLKLKKPIIVGYAMGGNVAQALAILFADKIRQLFLISTVYKWGKYACAFLDKLYNNRRAGRINANDALLYSNCFAEEYKSQHSLEEFHKICSEKPYIQTLFDEKRQITVLKQFDSSKLLKKIQAPTVVITPQEEKLATVEEGRVLVEKIGSNAEQIVVPDCGHAVLLEKPQEIIKILRGKVVK